MPVVDDSCQTGPVNLVALPVPRADVLETQEGDVQGLEPAPQVLPLFEPAAAPDQLPAEVAPDDLAPVDDSSPAEPPEMHPSATAPHANDADDTQRWNKAELYQPVPPVPAPATPADAEPAWDPPAVPSQDNGHSVLHSDFSHAQETFLAPATSQWAPPAQPSWQPPVQLPPQAQGGGGWKPSGWRVGSGAATQAPRPNAAPAAPASGSGAWRKADPPTALPPAAPQAYGSGFSAPAPPRAALQPQASGTWRTAAAAPVGTSPSPSPSWATPAAATPRTGGWTPQTGASTPQTGPWTTRVEPRAPDVPTQPSWQSGNASAGPAASSGGSGGGWAPRGTVVGSSSITPYLPPGTTVKPAPANGSTWNSRPTAGDAQRSPPPKTLGSFVSNRWKTGSPSTGSGARGSALEGNPHGDNPAWAAHGGAGSRTAYSSSLFSPEPLPRTSVGLHGPDTVEGRPAVPPSVPPPGWSARDLEERLQMLTGSGESSMRETA